MRIIGAVTENRATHKHHPQAQHRCQVIQDGGVLLAGSGSAAYGGPLTGENQAGTQDQLGQGVCEGAECRDVCKPKEIAGFALIPRHIIN